MGKKIIFSAVFILLAIFFALPITYANMDNSLMKDATDGVKNMVGGAENAIENAAGAISDTSKNATGAIENAGNNMTAGVHNTVNNMGDNMNNNSLDATNNNSSYQATRTATTSNDATFLGITGDAWVWIVMAMAGLAIGILIYSYFTQSNTSYEHTDE